MAYSLLAHTKITPAANGGTTPSIDTTGATLLIMVVSWYNAGAAATPNDSKSNTWVSRTKKAFANSSCQIFYVKNPTVGTGHTFTWSATGTYASVYILAFSGADTSAPYDVENGATVAAAGSLATGSVSPGANNELLIAGLSLTTATGGSIDNSFTITDHDNYTAGVNEGGAAAYLIQGTAGTVNPTWSWIGTSTDASVVIATFKASGGTTFNQAVTATVTSTSTLSRSVNKPLSFSCAPVNSMIRSVGKSLLPTLYLSSPVSTMVRQVGKLLSLSVTDSSTLTRKANKTLLLSGASTSSVVKQIGKLLSVSIISTSILVVSKTRTLLLTLSVVSSSSLVRSTGKSLTPSTTSVSSLIKQCAKFISQNTTPISSVLKQINKPLSFTTTQTSTLSRSTSKQVQVNVASTSSLVRSIGHAVAVSCASVSTVVKSITKTVLATVSHIVSLVATAIYPIPYRKVTVYGRDDTKPSVAGKDGTRPIVYGHDDTAEQVEGN